MISGVAAAQFLLQQVSRFQPFQAEIDEELASMGPELALIVERSEQDPNRVDCYLPIDVVNQLRIIAVNAIPRELWNLWPPCRIPRMGASTPA